MLTTLKTLPTDVARGVDTSRVRLLVQALLIVCVAVAVRTYDIGRQSLWTDELFSRYYADLFGLKFLWTTGFVHENSPPLYYMAIAGWMRLFGTSEVAMRSLSLVASVLTLPIIYLIGKELFDRQCGLIAALIFALSPMQIGFAQEARTYALLLLPISASLLAIARFLRGDTRQRVLWLYGFGVLLGLYCHATTAFFIAACNIAVVAAALSNRRIDGRVAVLRWVVANAVVAVVAMPELFAMLQQGRTGAGIEWIPPFRPVDIVRALSPVVSGTSTPDRFPGAELSTLLLISLAYTLFATPLGRRAWLVLVAIPALFVVLIAIASLYQPIFIARVFCWLGIPLALLLAHGIAARSLLRPFLAVVAVVVCITGLGYQFTAAHKEPWRDLLAQIGPRLARSDHMVLAPMTDPTALAYYAPYLTHLEMWNAGPRDNVENDDLAGRLGVQRITEEQLIGDIRLGANVWLILRSPDRSYVRSLLANVPSPRLRIERSCDDVLCIAALSWGRASSGGDTGASDR